MAFIDPEESWVACASALQYRKKTAYQFAAIIVCTFE